VKRNNHVAAGIDLALYTANQPHFISVRFHGGPDPLEGKRWGWIKGEHDELDLVVTDGRHGELALLPTDGSTAFNTASIQAGRGAAVRKFPVKAAINS
jgi:hypothetical protein